MEGKRSVRLGPLSFRDAARPPFESFELSFAITLEPHLSFEASHVFVKIKQTLCANVPKGPLDKFDVEDKEQFKITLLQTIYSVKWTFTKKQITR